MELFKKILSWKFIKGGHGYGFEIIQTSKEVGNKRVAILDCQDSVQEEYDTGFSIVPKTNCGIVGRVLNPMNENRFSDEELQLNGRLIANAPEMLNLLMEIYFSSMLYNVDKPKESEELNYQIFKLIYDKIGIEPRDMINDEYKKESVQQE